MTRMSGDDESSKIIRKIHFVRLTLEQKEQTTCKVLIMRSSYENQTHESFKVLCAFDLVTTAKHGNTSNVVQGAISTAFHLVVFEIVCCIVGIPLNLKVSFSILRSRRKYRRPRNILLLAVIFTNFSSFARSIIDICYHFWPAESTCKAYVSIAVLPDAFILMASFLSLVDRYMSISRPLWHGTKVTVPLVIFVIAFGFAIQTAILKIYVYRANAAFELHCDSVGGCGTFLVISGVIFPLFGGPDCSVHSDETNSQH